MRKRLALAVVLGTALAVAGVGTTSAYQPLVHVRPRSVPTECLVASYSCRPRIKVTLNDDFKPAGLPKKELAPVHFTFSGALEMSDGSPPPALEQVVVEVDRNVRLDAKGLPVCRPVSLKAATVEVPDPCKEARVGKGEMEFEVAFPESAPFDVKSHAVAYNGVKHDGKTTILIYTYLPNPVSAAILIRVEVTKIHRGRYGTKLIATIPKVAGGFGSLKELEFEFFRRFAYRHRKRSYLLAKCPDGKFQSRMELSFPESFTISGYILRPCTPKG